MPIESIEHGARQLLGFGGEIEVLEPPELRAKIVEEANTIIARHVL